MTALSGAQEASRGVRVTVLPPAARNDVEYTAIPRDWPIPEHEEGDEPTVFTGGLSRDELDDWLSSCDGCDCSPR